MAGFKFYEAEYMHAIKDLIISWLAWILASERVQHRLDMQAILDAQVNKAAVEYEN